MGSGFMLRDQRWAFRPFGTVTALDDPILAATSFAVAK